MPGRFLSRLGIFTPSILMHQLPEFLRGGVGAVELLLALVEKSIYWPFTST